MSRQEMKLTSCIPLYIIANLTEVPYAIFGTAQ